jgi:hypothetical protein
MMLLYRGPSRLDPSRRIIVCAVGYGAGGAANSKTGAGMVQIYIQAEPTAAIPTPALAARHPGGDRGACGTCAFQGVYAPTTGERLPASRVCYVHLGQGPSQVAKAFLAGQYEDWTTATPAAVAAFFRGRGVRLGAYGDPAAMPVRLARALVRLAEFWTGYTHAPHRAAHLRPYVMASVHNPDEAAYWQSRGWRTFRASPKGSLARMPGELLCPASKEAGHKLTCDTCRACDGTAKGRRANVMIPLHAGHRAAVAYAGVAGVNP